MEEITKAKVKKLEEPMIIENENDLERTKKVIKYFQKYYVNLLQYLIKSSPMYFESIITDCINVCKYITSFEPDPCRYMKDLRKLPVLIYMAKFYNNLTPHIENINQNNLDFFLVDLKNGKKCEFTTPFVDLPIDLTKIWKDLQKEQKMLIMKHLEYLYKMTDNATSVFALSAKMKEIITVKQQTHGYKRAKLKSLLVEKLNLDLNNKATEVIVNDVLDEFEQQQKMFKYGPPSSEMINQMIRKIYDKLIKRYQDGDITNDDIMSAGKHIYEQIKNNLSPEQFEQVKDLFGDTNLEDINEDQLREKLNSTDLLGKLQDIGIDESLFKNLLDKKD